MQNANAHKGLVYLIVTAILLLPVHLGYFSFAHADTLSPAAVTHTDASDHCDHAGREGSSGKCTAHPGMGGAAPIDDCCGDNCFGSQLFLPIAYIFQPVTGSRFQRTHSARPPEPLVAAEYRPPIHHS